MKRSIMAVLVLVAMAASFVAGQVLPEGVAFAQAETINNAEVVSLLQDNRPLAEILTVLLPACKARKAKMDSRVGTLIGAFDDRLVDENRPGVAPVNAYQMGVFNGILGDIITALEKPGVSDTLEAHSVRAFEVRRLSN